MELSKYAKKGIWSNSEAAKLLRHLTGIKTIKAKHVSFTSGGKPYIEVATLLELTK